VKPCLVNARGMKNVPGRRTDWHECQWLQFLHSVGLLRAAFRPDAEVCAVRSLMRYRGDQVLMANQHIQHMHKALTQMNVQIQHVISDITGLTGLAIVDSIIEGEQSSGTGQAARPAHQSQRRDDPKIAGGQLACGASVYAEAVTEELPALPGADQRLR